MVSKISSIPRASAAIAGVVVRHENTRLLVAMSQAADQEPALRALFDELSDGFVDELGVLLGKLGLSVAPARVDLLHALFVGLSVIDLATNRPKGQARAKAALEIAFDLLSENRSSAQGRN